MNDELSHHEEQRGWFVIGHSSLAAEPLLFLRKGFFLDSKHR